MPRDSASSDYDVQHLFDHRQCRRPRKLKVASRHGRLVLGSKRSTTRKLSSDERGTLLNRTRRSDGEIIDEKIEGSDQFILVIGNFQETP